jgi:predicted small lipoprotein YifL
MLNVRQIVGSARAIALVMAFGSAALLAGCGQKGPLYLPSGEAAAGRVSLPQSLNPIPAVNPPASSASSDSAPTETGANTANPAPRP